MRTSVVLCTLALPAITILSSGSAYAAAPSFSGTYSAKADGENAMLTLQQAGDGTITGTLKIAESTMELKGKADADNKRATGQVRINGMEIPIHWVVRREANALRFAMVPPDTGAEDPDTTIVFPLSGKEADSGTPDTPPRAEPTPAAASGAKTTLAGTFKGAEVTLTLKAGSNGTFTGTVQKDGAAFPITARKVGESLEGTFKAADDAFPFKASLTGDGNMLSFETDGTTHLLMRQGGANPLATAAPIKKPNPLASGGKTSVSATAAATSAAAPAMSAAPGNWQTYRHPGGVSMRYPTGWTIKEGNGAVYLLPPGVTAASIQPNALPAEVYAFRANPAPTLTSADDPVVLAMYDKEFAPLAQILQRTGGAEKVKGGPGAKGDGAILTWEGTNPSTSKPYRARVYAVLNGDNLLSLVALGDTSKLTAREAVTKAIFATLASTTAEHDPRVVGTWQGGVVDRGQILRGVGHTISGTMASDSSKQYRLLADGTVLEISHSRTIVNAGGASLDTGDNYETKKGQWTAGDGKLTLIFEDGRAINAGYRFNGDVMVVTYGDGSKQQFARR